MTGPPGVVRLIHGRVPEGLDGIAGILGEDAVAGEDDLGQG